MLSVIQIVDFRLLFDDQTLRRSLGTGERVVALEAEEREKVHGGCFSVDLHEHVGSLQWHSHGRTRGVSRSRREGDGERVRR